ncbi:conserved hypothetical protein [Burkholderia cenocepacia]|nr:conserved hypothetical protein [Burkholderia cenocepacia]
MRPMRRRSAKIDGQAPREGHSCSRWMSDRSGQAADDDSMTLRAGLRHGNARQALSNRRDITMPDVSRGVEGCHATVD